ncbi:Glycerophosphoryl diester phosphodiesterase family protein [Saccharicrinis carchari]|uniref:Glycerophosphoryl diester phosphodiesterase family protein n=1 Tax=Saccharicrinis carchari TaxID=1168039 RepID=A0A521AB81_SACCC|nr:glycerophosphodiester phosphodiesterase family protein [Saccharicrinis carchari]SMO32057.1 Glycerophosphoryl diester phosphodiesterase family protein [Saccharicrinis carchari]
MKHFFSSIALLFLCSLSLLSAQETDTKYHLIAHRGGIVDTKTPENSKEALLRAIENNYWMVEVDMRLTKDGVLITHHDKNLQKYFNVDKNVADMTWDEIALLKSDRGTSIQKLEDVFHLCQRTGMNIMIDNKIKGYDKAVCEKIIDLLDTYNLRENALMIGTSATTDFFTGKVRLSCTREQLETNMQGKDYDPDNYYYFGNPSAQDARWAKDNGIMIVGVINEWAIPKDKEETVVKEIVQQLKTLNINHVQLDSKYDMYFKE